MIQTILTTLLILFSSWNALACSCLFAWNDSFSRTAKYSEFVALAKIISFDEYLEGEVLGHEGKMPYAMTVEIINKYKGKEQRRKIKILGDERRDIPKSYYQNIRMLGLEYSALDYAKALQFLLMTIGSLKKK